MAEYLLILVTISCLLNTVLLYKIIAKGNIPEGTDTSLYDEQIKNLKRIIRLNEKYIKDIKNKEVKKDEETSVVSPEIQMRQY